MSDRTYRVAAGACLAALTVACGTAPAGTAANAAPVRVLQLNLCNSGIAGCYTGRSVAEAAAVIQAEEPDLVTLNEVCRDDVRALEEAMPGGATSAFQAARDRQSGAGYRCRNGQEYGIGVVSRWPSVGGSAVDAGIYPDQVVADPEERAWLCVDVAAGPAVTACTTHLVDSSRPVAGAQCRYLFGTVVARLHARVGEAPVVLGGDLNLTSGADPELAACLPDGASFVDDGGAQHVVATAGLTVRTSRKIDMHGTTDHPGLLVTLDRSGTALKNSIRWTACR
jgi:endonuclease/exonuclease/phosphatase family metal-dependent hydrolase